MLNTHTAYSCCCTCKVFVYNAFRYTKCFKYLCALIWLNCWDTHFRHNLNNTLCTSLVKSLYAVLIWIFKKFFVRKLLNSLICHIRIDTVHAVTYKTCEMVYFSRLTRFKNDRYFHSCTFSDKVMMKSGCNKKCRNRCFILIYSLIRKYDYVVSVFDCYISRLEYCIHGGFHIVFLFYVKQWRNCYWLKSFKVNVS